MGTRLQPPEICAPQPIEGSPNATERNEWLVWQLVDSAFPTGGFAHSNGLEAAWQHGEVRNRAELVSFTEASLDQLGHASLPFVTAAWTEPQRLPEFDALCHAFTSNHVANRASRLQGKAFFNAVRKVFLGERAAALQDTPWSHMAPMFGACLREAGIDRIAAGRMFVFQHLRGTFAAAVRLNIVGPMDAQVLQNCLSGVAEAVLARCGSLSLDDLAQTAPLLDLWQGAQDRLYSRLFQS
ncbi:MAG TPA: urease accessory UreF family protein [Verrucomicrobiae bacterium]|nr:urease accessory UreF family protein [Verrucomicrobiae bacterium]